MRIENKMNKREDDVFLSLGEREFHLIPFSIYPGLISSSIPDTFQLLDRFWPKTL